YGGVVLALGLLASAAIAYRARRSTPGDGKATTSLEVDGLGAGPVTHAPGSGVGGRTLNAALRPIRGAEAEALHLDGGGRAGEAGETPFIAIAGLVLFVLLPAYLVMLGLAFAAYDLA